MVDRAVLVERGHGDRRDIRGVVHRRWGRSEDVPSKFLAPCTQLRHEDISDVVDRLQVRARGSAEREVLPGFPDAGWQLPVALEKVFVHR